MATTEEIILKVTPQGFKGGADEVAKLATQLDKAEKELEDLTEGTAEYAEQQRKVNLLQRRVNQGLKQNTQSYDRLGRTVQRAGRQLRNLAVAAGVGAVFRNSLRTIKEFDSTLKNLSAITGATGGDLDFLSRKATELSQQSTRSATDVLKAFKLIGSAKPELLQNSAALADLTAKAITLSEASGIELAPAAEQLGSALNAMAIPAEEAGRVINVLAAASQKGTREIPFINEALAKFGGTAKQAGVSIETSVAAIETLGKAIPNASIAGTNLRNIITRLQIQAAKSGRSFKGLRKELDFLAPNMNDIAGLTKKFGQENLLAVQTLVREREALTELEAGITGTNTAYEQAETNTQTLTAQTTKLGNAWDNFILSLDKGDGVISKVIGNAITFFTELIGKLEDLNKTELDRMNDSIGESVEKAKDFSSAAATVNQSTFDQITKSAEQLRQELELVEKGTVSAFSDNQVGEIQTYNQKLIDLKNQGLNDLEIKLKLIEDQAKGSFGFLIDESLSTKSLKELNAELSDFTTTTEESIKNLEKGFQSEGALSTVRMFLGGSALEEDKAIVESNERIRTAIDQNKSRISAFASDVETIATTTAAKTRQIAQVIGGATEEELAKLASTTTDQAVKDLVAYEQTARAAKDAVKDLGNESDKASNNIKVIPNTIAALQKTVNDLRKEVTTETPLSSGLFAIKVEELAEAEEKLKEATDRLKVSLQETYGEDTIKGIQQRIAQLREELVTTSTTTDQFDNVAEQLQILEERLKGFQERAKFNALEAARANRDRLSKELSDQENFQLQIRQLEREGEQLQLEGREASAEELIKFEFATQRELLNIQKDFINKQLALQENLEDPENAARAEALSREFAIIVQELENLSQEEENSLKETRKQRTLMIADMSQEIVNTIIAADNAIVDAQIQNTQRLITAQEKRVQAAKEIADKGNAELLQLEEKRLEALNEKREAFVRRQQALAFVQTVAESTLAIARAASESGAGAIVVVPAVIAALGAGFAAATSLVNNSGSFFKGGYTGDGNPFETSTALGNKSYEYHKGEFVMPHDVTRIGQNKKIFGEILKHKLDLGQMLSPKVVATGGTLDTQPIADEISKIPQTKVYIDDRGIARINQKWNRKEAASKSRRRRA